MTTNHPFFNTQPFQLSNLGDIIKGIVFDMDGTLINSEPMHARAISQILLDQNNTDINLDQIFHHYHGVADKNVYEDLLLRKFISPDFTLPQFLKLKNETLLQILESEDLTPYLTPGLLPFLDFLKQKKINLAVVSASEPVIVESTLKHSGLLSYFDFFIAEDGLVPSKPAPDPYLRAFKKLNSQISEIIVFEDSPTGLTAALASGAFCIQITEFSPPQNRCQEIRNYLDLAYL